MTSIQFPRIRYPFPSRINQRVQEAHLHVTDWVKSYGLLSTEKALARFGKARFAWLVARAYPEATLEDLYLITDFNAWLFILDDHCDEAEVGKKSDYLRSVMAGLMDVLQNNKQVTLATAGPIPAALSNMWERMRAIATPAWRLRFIRSMEDYFSGCIWEAENREAGIVPGVDDYIRMRLFTGAVLPDVILIDIIEKIYLPESLLQHALLQRMVLAASNIICWANDMFSFGKESKQGDVHNLVLVLQHANQSTLQQALDEAARMHNEEVAIFATLEKLLPFRGDETDAELLRYVSILRAWIAGNFEWSLNDTGRYGAAIKKAVTA
ncbi:5-epi-alpha-selinene synthase [Chitinophaga niastensis]|uniref:Terpene synthase n=1 Tax=Chitinophaga niastensis TaxID=536980 RepID=A0A2P8HFF5_CHINA|nr:hypothetical protein [Chitinophaga niastensis]PSL44913.1 5-epi-alpha-selinene synthase [Chitinophaga niastensis]